MRLKKLFKQPPSAAECMKRAIEVLESYGPVNGEPVALSAKDYEAIMVCIKLARSSVCVAAYHLRRAHENE